jgi:hypothetical protein
MVELAYLGVVVSSYAIGGKENECMQTFIYIYSATWD